MPSATLTLRLEACWSPPSTDATDTTESLIFSISLNQASVTAPKWAEVTSLAYLAKTPLVYRAFGAFH